MKVLEVAAMLPDETPIFRIGAWSMLLLVLEVQLILLAILIARSDQNIRAARLLASALVVIAGMLIPFVIGYAGAYDAWPLLSFAPFAMPLALGPLLYGYVTELGEGRRIPRWHWLAPLAQFAVQALVFPWPLATKNWFDASIQRPFLTPIFAVGVIVSMIGYTFASGRVLSRYGAWLQRRRRDPAPAVRLRVPVVAMALLVIARAGYDLWDLLVAPVDYFDLFAYYILLGMIGLWIGIDGWRGAHSPVPVMNDPPERDWSAQGEAWIKRLVTENWWRDSDLDIETLARRLGTNSTHLSRALNAAEGSFSKVLGRIRSEAVATSINNGDQTDLLSLGLDAGFGSKASFNRAFRTRFGMPPSSYRHASVAKQTSSPLQAETRRVSD